MLNHAALSERYFFPRPGAPSRGRFEVTTRDGERLLCFREVRPENKLTVVYYHGNGETVDDHLPGPAEEWMDLGVNLVIVSYRGYGGSSGTPQMKRMLEDVQSVYEALDTPAERIVVVGRSLGSLYATEFAYRYPKVAGLVLESGIADPLERVLLRVHPHELGGTAEQLKAEVDEHLNQQRKLQSYKGPTLLLHARGDTMIAPSHAQRNHDWAGGPKRLVMFDRGDHNNILAVNREAYFRALKEFLDPL